MWLIYFSNSDGMITIPLNPNSSNDLTLTITKQDFKPYQTIINISRPDVNVNYDNSQNLVIIDDNDGIPSAGETIEISIPLTNFGSGNAENIQAVLTSTSNNVLLKIIQFYMEVFLQIIRVMVKETLLLVYLVH